MTNIITNVEAWGFIPAWIDMQSATPLWKQVDDHYAHGGGWKDFSGFDLLSGDAEDMYRVQYPEDPEYHEIGRIQRDDDLLIMFPHEWVLWQDLINGDWKMARID